MLVSRIEKQGIGVMSNDRREEKLDALFRAYRDACRDVEASANFMPHLWQKIEARQRGPFTWRRLTQVIVSAAAAMCLVMSLFMIPSKTGLTMSYLEALESEQPQ